MESDCEKRHDNIKTFVNIKEKIELLSTVTEGHYEYKQIFNKIHNNLYTNYR